MGREEWNAIRESKAKRSRADDAPTEQLPQGPQPAGPGSPSVIIGQPGWHEWLERNGMNPAFDEDDAWTKRIRGY
jgi:hypothetical protein